MVDRKVRMSVMIRQEVGKQSRKFSNLFNLDLAFMIISSLFLKCFKDFADSWFWYFSSDKIV